MKHADYKHSQYHYLIRFESLSAQLTRVCE